MRIGVVAGAADTTAKTIRFDEQAGLLSDPPRTPSSYRDYPAETAAQLAFIRTAQTAGLTLAEIRSVLAIRDDGKPPCEHVAALLHQHLADVEQRVAELQATRNILRDLADAADVTDPETCTANICRILT
ncbi:MerR family copper efflux transcriptional regulator [Catenulispora sp. GAS73]|uniref:heavy metal-responsive transcriptional regulator n=1 Tax=Catenulispora sp. GAS73 TaxID=3156269 RepID=UPI003516CC56